ncbi:hypothetical protein BGZ76_004307 [Entomortierella beljakovae]|nr:hypothetical protein BGZ76_004307 [Entomortierella beljakovae]
MQEEEPGIGHFVYSSHRAETSVTTTVVARHQLQPCISNNTFYSRAIGIESCIRKPDFTRVRDALATYYKGHLEIQRVSGETLDLEKCYVNLAIVEAMQQHQIDREHLKEQSESFIRMESYENVRGTKLELTIQIEDLFNKRKLCDGKVDTPKKILIQGRAGIGKTTFCKKLVHQFIQGRWSNRFEAVLWIPLRQLKIFKSRSLEDLIKDKYFTHHHGRDKPNLISDLYEGIDLDKVLFILDGLDEIIHDAQTDIIMDSLLKHLLQQTHLIITSRPSGVDKSMLPVFNLELETVGFSSNNIIDYVNNVLDEKAASTVMEFIEKTAIIRSLANIPVQLDVICYGWESLPKDVDSITVTKLYQVMVDKLWRNDAIRLEKSDKGKMISRRHMKGLSGRQVSHLMSTEMEYLSYLAFVGMKNNQIEFDNSAMNDLVEKLDHFREQTSRDQLPFDILEILKQTSFLHTANDDINSHHDLTQLSYHFIHLTFQEYFAATWLSEYFQINMSNRTTTSMLMNRDEAISFIQQNKYNPRYEIVWWMIAGQLEGEALESYFQLLQAAPRDLIGVHHQFLISGCYKEARSRLSASLVSRIQSELIQWLQFEMTFPEYKKEGSIIGRQVNFPEDVLIKSIDESKDNTKQLLRALTHRRHLTPYTIEKLTQMLSDKDPSISILAVRALGNQTPLSEATVSALITAVQDKNSHVQQAAANALSKQSTMSGSTIKLLIIALQGGNSSDRQAVVELLGKQSTMSESTTTALINALQGGNSSVRLAAVELLGKQSPMSESTTTALINALQDDDSVVREAATDVLSKQSLMSESIITALITSQKGKSSTDQLARAKFASQVKHTKWKKRSTSEQASNLKSTKTESTTSLQDKLSSPLPIVDRTLARKSTLSVASLLKSASQDSDSDVRGAAARLQSTLIDPTIPSLITSQKCKNSTDQLAQAKFASQVKHTRWKNRSTSEQASNLKSTKAESTTSLQDKPLLPLPVVVSIFDKKSSTTESSTASLTTALWSYDSDVRRAAAEGLSNLSTMTESAAMALVDALQDKYLSVRYAAAEALGNQLSLSQSTVALIIVSCQPDIIRMSLAGVLRTPRIYLYLNGLTETDIEIFYKKALFHYSSNHYVSLFIHENRLQIYTEQGFEKSEELSNEDLCKIESAFTNVQRSGGIENISYEHIGREEKKDEKIEKKVNYGRFCCVIA